MSNADELLIDLNSQLRNGCAIEVYLNFLERPLPVGVGAWHNQAAGLISFAANPSSDALLVREEDFRGFKLILPSPAPAPAPIPNPAPSPEPSLSSFQVQRAYTELGAGFFPLIVSCDRDFKVTIWAMNLDGLPGVISVRTPPSQFRSPNATGAEDAIALELAAYGRQELGTIGAKAGETVTLVGEGGVRLQGMITVETATDATVGFSR